MREPSKSHVAAELSMTRESGEKATPEYNPEERTDRRGELHAGRKHVRRRKIERDAEMREWKKREVLEREDIGQENPY